MRFAHWSPLAEFETLCDDFNRFFNGAVGTRRGAFPDVDVWRNDDGVVVVAQLPGMAPESIDVLVEENMLTVGGEIVGQQTEGRFHRRERTIGRFRRCLKLPFAVDADGTVASYENGVLTVKLARPAEEKPRRINVAAA